MENFVFNHPSHFSDMFIIFENFLRNRTMADVIIQCQGRNLYAHRLIISSGSEYFRSALVSVKVYSQMPIIIITDISFEVMESILDFIYRGHIIVPKEKVEAIRYAAAKLKIKGFENYIRKSFSQNQSFAFSNNQRIPSGHNSKSGFSLLNLNYDKRTISPLQQQHLNEMEYKRRRVLSPEHIQYNNNNGRYNGENRRSALEAALNGHYNGPTHLKKFHNMKRNYDLNGSSHLDLKMEKMPNDLQLNRASSPGQQSENSSISDSCDENDENKKNENMENAMEKLNNKRTNYYRNVKHDNEYDSDESNEANYTYEFDPKNFWENTDGNGNIRTDGEGEAEEEDYFEGISTIQYPMPVMNGSTEQQQGPFDCIKCSKRFHDINQLDIHFKRSHNLNKGNQCHICGKAYAWKSGLYKHKRHVHNIGGNGRQQSGNAENKSDNSLGSPDNSERLTPVQQQSTTSATQPASNENSPNEAD